MDAASANMQVATTVELLATCDCCKRSSPLIDAFRELSRARRRVKLCPSCVAEESKRAAVGSLWALGFCVIVGFLGVALGAQHNTAWLLLNLAILNVMMWMTVIPHEVGHAGVARLLGLQVYRITLGVGRRLASFTIGRVPIVIHLLPAGGATAVEVRAEPNARIKRIAVIAAGPLVHVAMLWLALHFGGERVTAEVLESGPAPLSMFIAACALGLVLTLLPIRVGAGYTDGAQLLLLLFTRKPPFAEAARAQEAHRASYLIEEGQHGAAERLLRAALEHAPEAAELRLALSASLLNQQKLVQGRELLLAMLPKGAGANGFEAVVFNNLAWADLLLDDPHLVEEARSLTAKAYRLVPWEPVVAGTFGSIEALHGDASRALAVLERIRGVHLKAHRASHWAAMAAAYARLERRAELQAALREAEKLDPACPLLGLVRARVANCCASAATK